MLLLLGARCVETTGCLKVFYCLAVFSELFRFGIELLEKLDRVLCEQDRGWDGARSFYRRVHRNTIQPVFAAVF